MSDTSSLAFLELRTNAVMASIRTINEILAVALGALEVDDAIRHDVALGVAELVANVCEHEVGVGRAGEVNVRLDADPGELRLTVSSAGPPFDLQAALRKAEELDPLEALMGSGLGLPLLVGLFDAIDHSYEAAVGNQITLRKSR